MRRILTIYRQYDIDVMSKSFFKRIAYRAVIFNGNSILMVKSSRFGEIKFPGGGKEANEKAFDVLSREVMEETGYRIKTKIKPFFSAIEYGRDYKGEVELFIQESKYYLCSIYERQSATSYFGYEIEYGYQPIWITLEEAIKNNELIAANDKIPWLERDTKMLKILLEQRRKNENKSIH